MGDFRWHWSAEISPAIAVRDAEAARQVFGKLSVIMPLEKTYWAEAFGMVTDKFGVKWMVNCETQ